MHISDKQIALLRQSHIDLEDYLKLNDYYKYDMLIDYDLEPYDFISTFEDPIKALFVSPEMKDFFEFGGNLEFFLGLDEDQRIKYLIGLNLNYLDYMEFLPQLREKYDEEDTDTDLNEEVAYLKKQIKQLNAELSSSSMHSDVLRDKIERQKDNIDKLIKTNQQTEERLNKYIKDYNDLKVEAIKLLKVNEEKVITIKNLSDDLEEKNVEIDQLRETIEEKEEIIRQIRYELYRYREQFQHKNKNEKNDNDLKRYFSNMDYTKSKGYKSAVEASEVPPFQNTNTWDNI